MKELKADIKSRKSKLTKLFTKHNDAGLLDPKQKYKYIDKDLINGFVVLTGKEFNEILEKSYKEHMESKNES